MVKIATLILPMAGRGSRFSAEGYSLPKPLISIKKNPMVVEAVNCLPETEDKIFICLQEHVDNYGLDEILDQKFKNCRIIPIDYVTQGQACTCEIGIKAFNVDPDSSILISACDNGVIYNKEDYEKLVSDINIDVIVWTFKNNKASSDNPSMYTWLEMDRSNFITKVHTKKFIHDDIKNKEAIIGTMFFRKTKYFTDNLNKNYEENIRTNGEFYVDDVLNQCIKSGLKVKSFSVDEYLCWGTPSDYEHYLKRINPSE